jgi:hypothetical protein
VKDITKKTCKPVFFRHAWYQNKDACVFFVYQDKEGLKQLIEVLNEGGGYDNMTIMTIKVNNVN